MVVVVVQRLVLNVCNHCKDGEIERCFKERRPVSVRLGTGVAVAECSSLRYYL